MKLVGVMDEDPFDPATWSGLSRYFFGALQARGVLRSALAASTSPVVRRIYQALSVQADRRRWLFRFHLNTSHYGAMTRAAGRRLRALDASGYDVVLQVGAWYDVPRLTSKPVVSYHDGSLATKLKSPYGHPSIAARHVQSALAHERDLYRRLALIFPMSRWLADSFITDYGVDHRKVIPIGAGINLPRVRPVPDKNYEIPRILFVGKDFERKGGRDLLAAFSLVRREVKAAELILIGPTLEGLPDGVRCLGPLSKRDGDIDRLLDEYARASLFVMPSLYEPFGVVFGEAMAHRCPCIGTNICAMPEIIAHGETGFVTPPGDPHSLARHMIAILKNPAMAKSFGDRGFERYQAHLTWDTVATKMCSAITTELGIA